jgi:hypothetical protein
MRIWRALQLIATGIGNFFYLLLLDLMDSFYALRYPVLGYINFKLFLAFF